MLCSDFGRFFDIEFVHLYRVSDFGRDLIENRQHHFARSAPGGPEIDQHRTGFDRIGEFRR